MNFIKPNNSFLTAIVGLSIIIICSSQKTKKSIGEYVIEYAQSEGIYFKDNTLISDNNFAIVSSNPLPDIRCFNSKGEAMNVLNCMASIVSFIDSVNNSKVYINKKGESLTEYLKNNSIQYIDGRPVTANNLPKRKFYVFYSYIYNNKNIPIDKLNEAWKSLMDAYNLTNKRKVQFYSVCITGIAINNTKFIH